MGARAASPQVAFTGAVLTGGRSSRMGRDKALLLVAGVPMATRVAHAMRDAGATAVFAVGGNAEALRPLGLRVVPDEAPHEGPLAGIIAALKGASDEIVVVSACDMPWIDAARVAAVVHGIGGADVAVGAANGYWQPLHAAWRRAVLERLEPAFSDGERSPLRAIRGLNHTVVELGSDGWSTDLDTPADFAPAEHADRVTGTQASKAWEQP